jgi:3-oxoadipate enol-lactonase
MTGTHDMATTVAIAESMHDRIRGSRMTLLDAAHISCIEQADAYTAEVLGFLTAA